MPKIFIFEVEEEGGFFGACISIFGIIFLFSIIIIMMKYWAWLIIATAISAFVSIVVNKKMLDDFWSCVVGSILSIIIYYIPILIMICCSDVSTLMESLEWVGEGAIYIVYHIGAPITCVSLGIFVAWLCNR